MGTVAMSPVGMVTLEERQAFALLLPRYHFFFFNSSFLKFFVAKLNLDIQLGRGSQESDIQYFMRSSPNSDGNSNITKKSLHGVLDK